MACPHGRRPSRCKECGGDGICEHGRERRRCKECGGAGICVHGWEHRRCKECSGTSLESHVSMSSLDVITLEATAVEECEGEEGPHFERLATVMATVQQGNGGQVVWSVAKYSGPVDSHTALS